MLLFATIILLDFTMTLSAVNRLTVTSNFGIEDRLHSTGKDIILYRGATRCEMGLEM